MGFGHSTERGASPRGWSLSATFDLGTIYFVFFLPILGVYFSEAISRNDTGENPILGIDDGDSYFSRA